jgi:hypothetical protein
MDDRAFIRSFEAVHDRRLLTFALLGLLAFTAVLIGVVAGFRGNHVSTSADAIVFTRPAQPRTLAAPLPARP